MRTIYIGSVYPDGVEDYYRSLNSRIDFAGNTFQTALLNGLKSVYQDIIVVSAPPISTYPTVRKIYFKGDCDSKVSSLSLKILLLRCINLPILKYLFRLIDLLLLLKRQNLKGARVIIYAIDSPTLIAARFAKYRSTKICLVVPDLPQYMRGTKGFFYKMSKGVESIILKWAYEGVDHYILLSKYMKEKLPVGNKPWMLMEGIYIDESSNETIEKNNKTTFLYTGNLGLRTGIIELIKAFGKLEGEDYELWIRGNGGVEDEVKKKAELDPRIKYIPPLSKEKLIALQKKATFLVNPVSPTQEFTKYFFPSKTMEYLASGTPTIMFKLGCLPDEYIEHVFLFEEDSVDSMYNSLKHYSSLEPCVLKQKGEKASIFIKEKKNAFVQAQRIKAFLG